MRCHRRLTLEHPSVAAARHVVDLDGRPLDPEADIRDENGLQSGRSIRLDSLRASVVTPTQVVVDGQPTTRMVDTGIRTDIELREGQKAVIDKASISGGTETVFVVVTGSIVE